MQLKPYKFDQISQIRGRGATEQQSVSRLDQTKGITFRIKTIGKAIMSSEVSISHLNHTPCINDTLMMSKCNHKIFSNNGSRMVCWEKYELLPPESGDSHNLNTHQLLSPAFSPWLTSVTPLETSLSLQVVCGLFHHSLIFCVYSTFTCTLLHLSITGVWNITTQ